MTTDSKPIRLNVEHLDVIKNQQNEDLYNREKGKEIEYKENNLAEFVQKVLNHCDAIFQQITKRREETPRTNTFRHFKKLEETKNKVNVPKVYRKNQVMPEGSLCRNSDRKEKSREKTGSDLKAQVELESCYLKKSGPKGDSNDVANFERIKKEKNRTCFDSFESNKFEDRKTWEFDQKREEKVETIPLGSKKIINSKTQKDNYCGMLTEDEEESVKERPNGIGGGSLDRDTLNHACKLWMRKVNKFRWINEGKETKIKENKKMHDSLQDPADMDCTKENEDNDKWDKKEKEQPERKLTEIKGSDGKAHKILKWCLKSLEVVIEELELKVLKKRRQRSKNWNRALDDYLKLAKVDYAKEIRDLEIVKLESDKMNDEKENRKMDNLPELDREVIQNIKWDEN
ncbi:41950_t:CDS:2, partial [Gigaspora margarita]